MTPFQTPVQQASRLIYKSLHTTLSPANDVEYRQLLAIYRADPAFADMTQDVAIGLELKILDVSERGLIVVPVSRDSKFAVRTADIRANLSAEQKAALVLVHVGIAASFYPTTDGLDDDGYIPMPSSIAQFRDAIYSLARHLKQASEDPEDVPLELAPGWELISALPLTLPASQRASTSSLVGLIKLTLTHMTQNGLTRLDRDSTDEIAATYTPTHRLRIQLREITLYRLFELAQNQVVARLEGSNQ